MEDLCQAWPFFSVYLSLSVLVLLSDWSYVTAGEPDTESKGTFWPCHLM